MQSPLILSSLLPPIRVSICEPRMAPLRALLLVPIVLSAHLTSASLKDTIQGIKNAHDTAAATARLKHIESLSIARPAVPTPNVDFASVGVLADDSSTLQVYTIDTAPNDAPAACSSALTAVVACNSTILDLGYALSLYSGDNGYGL